VPLLWSDAGWGVLVHTGGPVRADLGATHAETVAIAIDGDELDLFLLAGDRGHQRKRRRGREASLVCRAKLRPGALPQCRSPGFRREAPAPTALGLRWPKMTAYCEISPASFAGVDDLDRIDAERARTLMTAAGMASAA
jgi:hypothetical protein